MGLFLLKVKKLGERMSNSEYKDIEKLEKNLHLSRGVLLNFNVSNENHLGLLLKSTF